TTRALERLAPHLADLPDPARPEEPAELEKRYHCTAKGDDPVDQPELRRRWRIAATASASTVETLAATLTADGWTVDDDGGATLTRGDDRYAGTISRRLAKGGRTSTVTFTVRVADVEPCLP